MKKFLTYVCLAVFLFAGVYASITMAEMPRTYDGTQANVSVYELQQNPDSYNDETVNGAADAIVHCLNNSLLKMSLKGRVLSAGSSLYNRTLRYPD